MQNLPELPPHVLRRFVLGRQGLWPGRRWRGKEGTEAAMRAVVNLQLDPLTMISRSQDLMLHSRVLDYTEEGWQEPAYTERKFFDWGNWLAVRPMEELPYYRNRMRRIVRMPHYAAEAERNAELLQEMRELVRANGPVSNRDFAAGDRVRVDSYRGRKDSSVALFHLWITGELMVSGRTRFERTYDLTERIAPPELLQPADDAATERFLLRKALAFYGMHDGRSNQLPPPNRPELAAMQADSSLATVRVEGQKRPFFVLQEDLSLLEDLLQGTLPAGWEPLESTTTEEVAFLAPLDVVSARGRARQLFGFDYVWEVYTPAAKRKWGYYTLPILWGDRLVARADMKFDRQASTLQILGFWLEDSETGSNGDFATALGHGLGRLQRFLGAEKLDAAAVRPVSLRKEAVRAARSPYSW